MGSPTRRARCDRVVQASRAPSSRSSPTIRTSQGSALGSSFYLRASADAVLPVLREAYRVNAGALVHRAPSVGFRGGLALGVVLGGGG